MANVTSYFQHCLYSLALRSAFRQCSLAHKRAGQTCSWELDSGEGCGGGVSASWDNKGKVEAHGLLTATRACC